MKIPALPSLSSGRNGNPRPPPPPSRLHLSGVGAVGPWDEVEVDKAPATVADGARGDGGPAVPPPTISQVPTVSSGGEESSDCVDSGPPPREVGDSGRAVAGSGIDAASCRGRGGDDGEGGPGVPPPSAGTSSIDVSARAKKRSRDDRSQRLHLESTGETSFGDEIYPVERLRCDSTSHRAQCLAYQSLIKKLVRKSNERRREVEERCDALERKLAAQDDVVRMVPILTGHCAELQRVLRERDCLIRKLEEERRQRKSLLTSSFRFSGRGKKTAGSQSLSSGISVVSELTDDF